MKFCHLWKNKLSAMKSKCQKYSLITWGYIIQYYSVFIIRESHYLMHKIEFMRFDDRPSFRYVLWMILDNSRYFFRFALRETSLKWKISYFKYATNSLNTRILKPSSVLKVKWNLVNWSCDFKCLLRIENEKILEYEFYRFPMNRIIF